MYKFDRLTKVFLVLLTLGVWCLLLQSIFELSPPVEAQSKTAANQSGGAVSPVIKTRGVIIVDEKGRERVILGAPMPDPPVEGRKRVHPGHGMMILDPEGYERFGVGLLDNGQMSMGFDAPPGKGDDRNRERLHFIADPEGGATIRFLNRKTSVPGRIRLGEDDNLYLEFIDVQKDKNKVIKRKIGIKGEETVEEPFK
jgi:FtsP/CotA-like multicopper oxidase with cupredoxin domain